MILFANQVSLETMKPEREIVDEQEKFEARMFASFWLGFSYMESPMIFHLLNLRTPVTMIVSQLYGAAVIYYLK